MAKLTILTYATCAVALIFSLVNISFHPDISLLAMPLSLVFSIILFLCARPMFTRQDARAVPVTRKLLQYLPFVNLASFVLRRAGETGAPFALDAVSVALWAAVFALSLAALRPLADKRVWSRFPELEKNRRSHPAEKPRGLARLAREILEWADALVQAVFLVTLIHIFLVQLYEIPSESMVSEFLVRDRVVVFKTPSGSRFPLSPIGLPRLRSYRRGDIVVFRNPHYSQDRKSEVKTFAAQLVYMLTFTTVNLNVDEAGDPKADPLVKRVTGEAGEQLMMQDGVLYARRSGSRDFRVVAEDSGWAKWDLASLPADVRKGVRSIPLSRSEFDALLAVESLRNSVTYAELRDECAGLAAKFAALRAGLRGPESDGSDYHTLVQRADFFEYRMLMQNESLTQRLLTAGGGAEWFSRFMTGWIAGLDQALFKADGPPAANRPELLAGGSLYDDANFRFNLLLKRVIGRLVVRNAELTAQGAPSSSWATDEERRACLAEAEKLNSYAFLLDRRNMPLFPANASDGSPRYIPENEYFMMGDNRFNSLDMRHSYDDSLQPLSALDPMPLLYLSNIAPQSVSAERILGAPIVRVWPFSRIGVLHSTR